MKEETLHPKDPAGKTTLRPGVLLLGGVGGVTRGIACKEYPGSRWESTSSQAARSHCSIVVRQGGSEVARSLGSAQRVDRSTTLVLFGKSEGQSRRSSVVRWPIQQWSGTAFSLATPNRVGNAC